MSVSYPKNSTSQKKLFKFLKWLMLITGTWQQEIPNLNDFQKKAYKIYAFFIRNSYYYYPIACILELFRLLKIFEPNHEVVVDNISKTIFGIMTIIKINMAQTQGIKDLIEMVLEEEENILARDEESIKKIYDDNSKYCTKTVYVFIAQSMTTGTTLLLNGVLNVYYLKKNPTSVDKLKVFPLSIWLPFDIYEYPAWTMFIESILIYMCILFLTMVITLLNTLMIFLRAQTKILQHDLENFGYVNDIPVDGNIFEGDCFKSQVKQLIVKHQMLIRSVSVLNSTIKNLLLLEYSVTSLVLACLLVQVMAKTAMAFNGMNFILTAGQIMVLSWNANEIRDESLNLCTSCYKSNWYRLDQETKQIIQIMMMRSLKPLTISLGPLGALTVGDGLSRVKIAYSYMSLMQGN